MKRASQEISQVLGSVKPSGRNSMVECQLPKLDVAGSIPVARSILLSKTYKVGGVTIRSVSQICLVELSASQR
jgi:hypothetical protein